MRRCRNILYGWLLALLFVTTAHGQTPATLQPVATQSGLTVSKVISAATANATVIKASPGRLYAYICFNNAATSRYLHLYNKATAPTVGTDVPAETVGIAPSGGAAIAAITDIGVNYPAGIALSITTGIADTDATATGANEVVCNIRFN